MWKQNELWRNVHEAQFEHLRRVYKRQWLEAFRVNSDAYICTYNVTKSAQMAQWESEMHAQEAKRVEALQLARGRQALKKKHMDLLREFHERQFFYWYERASERLQYMDRMPYVSQSNIQQHIERELDKYVAGSRQSYPLNFAGQLPMLEDKEGGIAQVPLNLLVNHTAENPGNGASAFTPPQGVALAEERLLQLMASAQEEELEHPSPSSPAAPSDAEAFSSAISDVLRGEDAAADETKVARSMEESEEEREVSRRAYIDRGKTGSKTIFRPRGGEAEEGSAHPATGGAAAVTPPPTKRRKRHDRNHAAQQELDRQAMALLRNPSTGESGLAIPKVGEIGAATGRIRDRVAIPTAEEIKRTTDTGGVRMQSVLDQKYNRGKHKNSKNQRGTPPPDADDV